MRHRNVAAAALLVSTPAVAKAQQPPAKARTVPPDTNVVLPRPDFHFRGTVGRTVAESDGPQFRVQNYFRVMAVGVVILGIIYFHVAKKEPVTDPVPSAEIQEAARAP